MKEKNDVVVLDELKMGDYIYIYIYFEYMIGKKIIYDSLVLWVYFLKICLIVVDEVYCVFDWGEEYRLFFCNIKDMCFILFYVKMFVLSVIFIVNG